MCFKIAQKLKFIRTTFKSHQMNSQAPNTDATNLNRSLDEFIELHGCFWAIGHINEIYVKEGLN